MKKVRFETQNYHRVTEMIEYIRTPYRVGGGLRYYAGYIAGRPGMGKSEIAAQVEQSAADLGYSTYIVKCSGTHTVSSFLRDVLNALDRVPETAEVNSIAVGNRRLLRMVAQRLGSAEFYAHGKAMTVVILDDATRIWKGERRIFNVIAELIDMRLCPIVLSGWRETYDSLLQGRETRDYVWRMPHVCEMQSLDIDELNKLLDTLGELIYPPLVRKEIWKTVGGQKNSISDIQRLVEKLDRMKYSVKEATVELVQQAWAVMKERAA